MPSEEDEQQENKLACLARWFISGDRQARMESWHKMRRRHGKAFMDDLARKIEEEKARGND